MDATNVRKRIEQIRQDMKNANDKMAVQYHETSQMMAKALEDPKYFDGNILAILLHQNSFIGFKADFIAHALELQTVRLGVLQEQFQLVLDAIEKGLEQSVFKVN